MGDQTEVQYSEAYEAWVKRAADSTMIVLRDDGVYRHIRFEGGGARTWRFDLITWPGHLLCDWRPARPMLFFYQNDMLDFFADDAGEGEIKPDSWSAVLREPSAIEVMGFSGDKFREWLLSELQITGLEDDYREIILTAAEAVDSSEAAFALLAAYNIPCPRFAVISWRDYSAQFLSLCHAILWGVRRYRKEARG